MLSLRRPTKDDIHRVTIEQAKLDFTYAAVGATAGTPPSGYQLDHARQKLGEGETAFQAARAALNQWRQFALGWVEAIPVETPIRAGEVIAVLARTAGLWSLNACRIVYVVDESGAVNRFGFAYGTLPEHAESGEERFLIEWDKSDDTVSYDILAFSRPNQLLTKLGYPVVRRFQSRFRRDSMAAMADAVRTGSLQD